ncbi:MAG TPA: DUF3418 domain-containing protein [Microbacteriaceae bacterium]|nr:DUF3418 domain-containing protein [Microbacteriaceae bacterium]
MSTPPTLPQAAPPLVISYPPDLPVSARREEIAKVIRDNQVVIVAGETGSGKTTQLPKICLEMGRRSIGHTQPRRLAARTIAERIADELGVEVGGLVGYQVRFTDHAGPETRIKLMTDGILLNQMHHDRLLRAYDTIIIDEAHERSLTIDFLLGYLKRILPRRPDLKVIVTSATIDPESFARHFASAGEPAPVVEVSGRTFPVEIRYRPRVDTADGKTTGQRGTQPAARGDSGARGDADGAGSRGAAAGRRAPARPGDGDDDVNDAILAALAELDREKPGDVLVFLSGEAEIRDAADAIRAALSHAGDSRTEVLPLYGRLSAADQHRVFQRPAPGVRRRIVLATNVAETSLTVPGIRYVIDAGMARISRYSARAKVQRLPIEPISQASAKQRSGRSGRQSSGIAIRLYSEEDYAGRSEYTEPEILRTNLASVILQMLALGLGEIEDFPFLTPPDRRGVKDGLGLLAELGAIDGAGRITPTGRSLARLPIEPRFGRMVLEAERLGVARPVRAIVAGLTVQDPRERPMERRAAADQAHARFVNRDSDFLTLLNLWNYLHDKRKELSSSAFRRLCKAEFLNYLRVREWQDVDRQLKRLTATLRRGHATNSTAPQGTEDHGIHQALLAGLLSQIGLRDDRAASSPASRKRHGSPRGATPRRRTSDYIGSRQTRFTLHPSSALAKKPPAAVMSAELVETSRLYARMNAAIDPQWAERLAGDLVKRAYGEPHWEKRQGQAVAYETVTLYGVPIVTRRRVRYAPIDQALSRELFLRHALVAGEFDPHGGHTYDFLRANDRLRGRLAEREERTRRRDVLYDDEAVFDFYDARIPPEVTGVRDFEAWWNRTRPENPGLLTMAADEWGETVDPDTDAYPETWRQGDQTFALEYHFAPGSDNDGVSVLVPMPLLARLRPEAFTWQVPGLRPDLVTALLKSLPKALRRHVVPAADWAAKVLADLPETPPEGRSLTEAAAASIRRLTGTLAAAGDFSWERVPPHLRMSFCAVDGEGRVAGRDKDLAALQQRLSERARRSVARAVAPRPLSTGPAPARPGRGPAVAARDAAGRRGSGDGRGAPLSGDGRASATPNGIERSGITSWDFDEVPQTIDTRLPAPGGRYNVVRGYPSLALRGGAVDLVVLSTPEERRRVFPAAVLRLVTGTVASPASYVADHLTPGEKLSLGVSGYRTTAALFDDCLTAIAADVLHARHPDGMVFTRAEFEEVRDALHGVVVDRMFQTVALVARILQAARAAKKAVEETANLAWLTALTDMRTQLEALVFPGFVTRTGLTALVQLPRYLAGVAHRLAVLPRDPARDRARMNELDEAAALFARAGGSLPLPADAPAALRHARWMLEEFRVSLFAQQLGTAEPVSLKRIRRALAEAKATARPGA